MDDDRVCTWPGAPAIASQRLAAIGGAADMPPHHRLQHAVVATLPCVLGVDDLWFDAARRQIYAPGFGAIDVFLQVGPNH
jgi:hypothetical protein